MSPRLVASLPTDDDEVDELVDVVVDGRDWACKNSHRALFRSDLVVSRVIGAMRIVSPTLVTYVVVFFSSRPCRGGL